MKYWDDFNRRALETKTAFEAGDMPPLRRLSVHVTNGCNFKCDYCNEVHHPTTLPFSSWAKIVQEYSEMGGGIIHVTGGEPSVVKGFANYITETGKYPNVQFHLNTNLYGIVFSDAIWPLVKRLKVSLDTMDADYFDKVTRRPNAFNRVTTNLDRVHKLLEEGKTDTVVSLTYTVTKENYSGIPEFLEQYEKRWPLFYATFFSSYKGTNERFALEDKDVEKMFKDVVPELNRITEQYNDTETQDLFHASHDPLTFQQTDRFPENRQVPCWLQLSELCLDESGDVWNCSHLFRDKVPSTGINILSGHLRDVFYAAKEQTKDVVPLNLECLYGCNRKLTAFNEVVESMMKEEPELV